MALNYNNEQLEAAKSISLTSLAQAMGYTVKRAGNCYTLVEMDSIRIYNDRTWYRWSGHGTKNGGSTIDFMLEFGNAADVPDAVHKLLDFGGFHSLDIREKEYTQKLSQDKLDKTMILPEKADSYRIAYAYLMKQRGLSYDVIDYFVNELKILYEDRQHHNMVFLGKDSEGNIQYAFKRGTGDVYGRVFKGDVSGSNKKYGVNIVHIKSDTLMVFEAAIDMMSYIDVTGDYESNKLALGMLDDSPLITFLNEQKHIRNIVFCLDNDIPAHGALYGKEDKQQDGLLKKYKDAGYNVYDKSAPSYNGRCKDYNDVLKCLKVCKPEAVYALCSSIRQKAR